jgi:hypothetical protein
MCARLFILSLSICFLLNIACYQTKKDSNDTSTSHKDAPNQDIHSKTKSQSDLLIGKWEAVTLCNANIDPKDNLKAILIFRKDGTFSINIDPPSRVAGDNNKTGTYKLNNNVLTFIVVAAKEKSGKTWEVTIESLSDVSLKIINGPPEELERDVFIKIE